MDRKQQSMVSYLRPHSWYPYFNLSCTIWAT